MRVFASYWFIKVISSRRSLREKLFSVALNLDSRKRVNVKKILAASITVIFLLTLPILSFAKTAISDQELETLSAEAGVTLDFSAPTYTAGSVSGSVLVTNWSPAKFSWGDSDGFTGYTSSGWAGLAGSMNATASNIIMYNAMTLDVGSSGTVTKLNIGLPSILIHPVETQYRLRIGANEVMNQGDHHYALGTLYNDKFALIVNPSGVGSITISNHADNTQGLEMALSNFYLAIPAEAIDISWGDESDGFTGPVEYRSAYNDGAARPAANVTESFISPGYFGLRDYVTSGTMLIGLSGSANIDVGSSGTRTALNIVLPTTTINPTRVNITAPLVMSTAKELPGTQIVGILDVRGFSTTMTGSMQIFSH
jgi:hypothetical protein